MGLMTMARPLRAAPRLALVVACALLPLLASGCKEARDVGEEMGWIKPREEAAPAPVDTSLAALWIPVDTAVADLSQARWSEHWWQWVDRFAADGQWPYLDPDGGRCAQHQDGPVWYLAGTDGNSDAERTCSIPAGKHVFVPLINWVIVRGPIGEALSCAEKQAAARQMADHVTTGLVLLDGRPIGDYKQMRVASTGCFAAPGGEGASDGYWLMLKPLPPGKHQLAIAAAYRDGPRQSMQNFRYELEVAGEGAAAQGDVAAGAAP